ncbi:MAG: hypothetical protein Q9187_008910 [Circinaria calcarea]
MPEPRADSGVGRGERSRDERAIEDMADSSLLGRTIDPVKVAKEPRSLSGLWSAIPNRRKRAKARDSLNEGMNTSTGNSPSGSAGSPLFRKDSNSASMERDPSRIISLENHNQLDGNEADTSDNENLSSATFDGNEADTSDNENLSSATFDGNEADTSDNDDLWLATSDSPPLETLDSVLSMGSACTSPLPLGVDSDEDILRPLEWIDRLKDIEKEVFEKSYYWFKKEPLGKGIQGVRSSSAHSSQTYFRSKFLPSFCEVQGLDESWQHLRHLEFELESEYTGRNNSKQASTEMALAELVSLYVNFHLEDRAVTEPKISREWKESIYGAELDMMKTSLNILITLCRTIEALQERGICNEGISIFVANHKSGAVRLEPIRLSKIVELVQRLNRTLRSILWGLRNGYTARNYCTGRMPNFKDNYGQIFDLEGLQAMEQSASFATISRPLGVLNSLE